MARGFDSKSVESQQSDAFDRLPKDAGRVDPAAAANRHRLEITQTDLKNRLKRSSEGAYKELLRRSLAAIEDELSRL